MLHSIAEAVVGQGVIPGIGLIEDSGEMFVTSLLVAFVSCELRSAPPARAPSGAASRG
jgi:hypothetical protein